MQLDENIILRYGSCDRNIDVEKTVLTTSEVDVLESLRMIKIILQLPRKIDQQ